MLSRRQARLREVLVRAERDGEHRFHAPQPVAEVRQAGRAVPLRREPDGAVRFRMQRGRL